MTIEPGQHTKKQNKLIIVDFGARWCPACLRLEKEIFSTKEFSQVSKNYLKVKLDGDVFFNGPIMERYKVKGYPTILFLTSQGEEIIRFMDYQNMDVVKEFIQHVEKYPISISELEKRKDDPAAEEGLWKRYYYSGDFEKTVALLEKKEKKPKEYLSAKVELALANKEAKDKSIQVLKDALKSESESTRSLMWRSELASLLSEKKQNVAKLAEEGEKLFKSWLEDKTKLTQALETDSIGEFAGFELFYASLIYADLAERAQWKAEEAWKQVVSIGSQSNITPDHPGASLRLFNAMMKAKSYEPALAIVNGLLSKKKNDADLQRRKMRVLMELGRHQEAIVFGERALKNSYGRNEFDVALPLAKSYLALGRKKEALVMAEKYLNKNEVNFPRMASTKKELLDVKDKSLAKTEGPAEAHPDKK